MPGGGISSAAGPDAASPGRVLLLHGIGLRAFWLRRLERHIRAAGFVTLNLDYPSRRLPLERLVEEVRAQAGGFLAGGGRLYFVGHSMGGLLARAYITRYQPVPLGGVVMLGPPNQGSEIADFLLRNRLYQRVFGPAGQQLGTRDAGRMAALLGVVDYPLGVIAGDRALSPLAGLLLPGPHDGKVAVARTVAPGMTDHLTLPTSHTMMVRHAEVLRQTVHFLQHGRFDRPDGGHWQG